MKQYKEHQIVKVGVGFVHNCVIISFPEQGKIRFKDLDTGKYHTWNYDTFYKAAYE